MTRCIQVDVQFTYCRLASSDYNTAWCLSICIHLHTCTCTCRTYCVMTGRSRTLRRPLWQWWRVCRWTLNSRRSPTRCVPRAGPPACSSAWRGHRGRSTPPQVRTIPGCQTCLGWNSSSSNDNTINNSLTITNKCLIGLSSHVNKVNHVWYVCKVCNSIALVYILRPHNMSII